MARGGRLRFKAGVGTIIFGVLGEITGAYFTWQIFLVARTDCFVWPSYLEPLLTLIQEVTGSFSPCKNGPGLDGWYSWEVSFSWMLVSAILVIAGAVILFFALEGVK